MYGRATTLDAILNAIVARVAAVAKLPPQTVFVTLVSDESHAVAPAADRFVTVRPVSLPVAVGVAGGGRATTGFDAEIHVGVMVRFGGDQELRQTKHLNDKSLGVIKLAGQVADALQLFEPVNADGEVIVREPIRLLRMTHETVSRKPDSNWVCVRTAWQVIFNQELST